MLKQIEECLATSKLEIGPNKLEVQRSPIVEKTVEKMHAMLVEMYEDRQRQ